MTTTTTELALIPDDTDVVVPLTKPQAKALDKRIRAASDKVSATTENLLDLLEQAAAGQIHEALELPSWTAWFKDAVQISVNDKHDRKELVKLMSGKGMSQRAIAGSLGVSQKTVDRDLEGVEVEAGATVTSLDGAERPKTKPIAAEGDTVADAEDAEDYIDAEVIEPTPAAEIVESFNDEVANLWAAAAEMKELAALEKWGNARNRIAKENLNNLQEVITGLQTLVDDLMES